MTGETKHEVSMGSLGKIGSASFRIGIENFGLAWISGTTGPSQFVGA